jgi:hypothetical protein
MAVSYFWTVNPLEAYPTSSGESDVVFTAHWQLHATETVGETTYNAQSIGTQGLTYASGSAFTPFEELTLEQVSGWVENAMGTGSVDSMKAGLAQNIANQIVPPTVTLQSPSLTTTTTTSTTTTTTTIAE